MKEKPYPRSLYIITARDLVPGRTHLDVAQVALSAGVKWIQLRDKEASTKDLVLWGWQLRKITRKYGAYLLINDRCDVALAVEADGVHLGQEDMPLKEARRILGAEAIIGISVENEEQSLLAEREGADYLGVGPIYATTTKPDAGKAVGLEQIHRIRAVSSLPIVAVGGIQASNAPEVLSAGASAIAVISAVAGAENMEEAIHALLNCFPGGKDETERIS